MDPDEVLRIIRLTIKQLRTDTDPDIRKAHARELAEHVENLDEWISKGGFLPRDWSPKGYEPLRKCPLCDIPEFPYESECWGHIKREHPLVVKGKDL